MSDSSWQVFDINAIQKSLAGDKVQYKQFLNVPSLSCGVYHLPTGSKDMQTPHDEDEVYYVLEGRARMKVGDEDREISAGNVLYVKATETHSFFEIEEDMTLLVFFASEVG
ncbi:MAG: cupin domain-containing protein [Pseudomonadales bacterium]|jgi:mannose-6-phosphate isomerase-like protein (cupin superfamily)